MGTARVAVVAILLGLALGGCSAGDRYAAGAARDLQQGVLAVARSSSTKDYPTALKHLAELERSNDRALQNGQLTKDRHDAVAGSIADVRSDLRRLEAQAKARAQQEQQSGQQPKVEGGDAKKGDENKDDEKSDDKKDEKKSNEKKDDKKGEKRSDGEKKSDKGDGG